jgi:hypothetical protein
VAGSVVCLYPVCRPHIEAAPARSEDANVPEPAASKSGRQRWRPPAPPLAQATRGTQTRATTHSARRSAMGSGRRWQAQTSTRPRQTAVAPRRQRSASRVRRLGAGRVWRALSGIRTVQTIRFCHCAVSTVAVFAACHGLSRSRPCTTLHSLSASRCCLEQVEGAGDPGTQAIRIAPVGPADREHRAAGARQDAEQRQRAPPRRQPARTV